jgi:hypothetical protein
MRKAVLTEEAHIQPQILVSITLSNKSNQGL